MTDHLSREEGRKALQAAKKRRKYGNNRAQARDGRWFDSTRERDRYEELLVLQRSGQISHLECQPSFHFAVHGRPLKSDAGRQLLYKADFAYFEGQERVVEDVKSVATKTDLYKLKKALVEAMYPGTKIREVMK